jgi:hypothetical protein
MWKSYDFFHKTIFRSRVLASPVLENDLQERVMTARDPQNDLQELVRCYSNYPILLDGMTKPSAPGKRDAAANHLCSSVDLGVPPI